MNDTFSTGASEAAKTIEWWHDKFIAMKSAKRNAVNCAYLVMKVMLDNNKSGPRNSDRDVDQIANAMLAFKRIGSDAADDIEWTTIYVESAWVTKFVDYLIERSLRYRLEHEKDEKCKIILPKSFSLREELPSHLRGKFSVNP